MRQEYLRQIRTGRIYIRTPELAARKDMVPYDPDQATARIEALKKRIEALKAQKEDETLQKEHVAELQAIINEARELTDLENEYDAIKRQEEAKLLGVDKDQAKEDGEPKSAEQIEKERIQGILETDAETIAIKEMTDPEEIRQYLEIEYGMKPPKKKIGLEELRELALEKRKDRILEAERAGVR